PHARKSRNHVHKMHRKPPLVGATISSANRTDQRTLPASNPQERSFMPGRVRIGISGWNYKGWRGKFYPPKLPHKQELAYAASLFPSIEINGTFYSLQRPSSFKTWAEQTPDDFVFAIKGSRFITHMLKLRGA